MFLLQTFRFTKYYSSMLSKWEGEFLTRLKSFVYSLKCTIRYNTNSHIQRFCRNLIIMYFFFTWQSYFLSDGEWHLVSILPPERGSFEPSSCCYSMSNPSEFEEGWQLMIYLSFCFGFSTWWGPYLESFCSLSTRSADWIQSYLALTCSFKRPNYLPWSLSWLCGAWKPCELGCLHS